MCSRASQLWFLISLTLASAGCGTRYVRVPLQEDDDTKVLLRAELRDGKPLDRGFHHPATISGVRLAHMLAQLDVRVDTGGDKKSERQPAIPTDLVYPLGDALSNASIPPKIAPTLPTTIVTFIAITYWLSLRFSRKVVPA